MFTRVVEEIKSIFERDPAARNTPEVIFAIQAFKPY